MIKNHKDRDDAADCDDCCDCRCDFCCVLALDDVRGVIGRLFLKKLVKKSETKINSKNYVNRLKYNA